MAVLQHGETLVELVSNYVNQLTVISVGSLRKLDRWMVGIHGQIASTSRMKRLTVKLPRLFTKSLNLRSIDYFHIINEQLGYEVDREG